VLAALVFLEHEHELAVIALREGWPREVTAPGFVEASEILVFELDPVVLAAGTAR